MAEQMDYRVEIWYGWGKYLFYYSTIELARNVAANAIPGSLVKTYRRTADNEWEEI